jgi:hypothetical protein
VRLLLAKFEAEPLKCWIWKLLKGQIAYEPAFLAKAVAKAEWHLQKPFLQLLAACLWISVERAAGAVLLIAALIIGLTAGDYGATIDEFNTNDYGTEGTRLGTLAASQIRRNSPTTRKSWHDGRSAAQHG